MSTFPIGLMSDFMLERDARWLAALIPELRDEMAQAAADDFGTRYATSIRLRIASLGAWLDATRTELRRREKAGT